MTIVEFFYAEGCKRCAASRVTLRGVVQNLTDPAVQWAKALRVRRQRDA